MVPETLLAPPLHATDEGSKHADDVQSLRGLTVAYLMNQHPSPSVSFIRREIVGLEEASAKVYRFSIRRWQGQLVDPADKFELARTEFLLDHKLRMVWDVIVCLFTAPAKFLQAAILCCRVGWISERGILRTWMYLFEACRLKRRLQSLNIQWIHAHFGTNSTAVAMFCRVLGGPSYSFTVHGPEEFDRPELLHLKEKIAHASMVIAISKFCQSQLYRWCPWHQWDKIRIVRCGISETFAEQVIQPITALPNLVCVARLSEQKGLPILIEAAEKLVRANVPFRLELIGDGDLRAPLERLIVEKRLQEHVFLRGWQTEKQIRAAIENSRALVLPSFAEGLPVVLMEALALGRPVISTKIAGISELVVSGENGWLVDAGDSDSLVSAMRLALETDPIHLKEMGQCGAAVVFKWHLAKHESRRLGNFLLQGISPEKAEFVPS